jgi:hypothetical protein
MNPVTALEHPGVAFDRGLRRERGSWESDDRHTACAGIAIDVLVIYALTVHGKETKAEYG